MTALKHLAILPRSAAKWLGRRLSAKQLLTKNEARRIAANVAKLLELLGNATRVDILADSMFA